MAASLASSPSSSRRRVTLLPFGYLLLMTAAIVGVGISTWRWLQGPFLGVLVEPTGVVSPVPPWQAGTWEGRQWGLTYPDRLVDIDGTRLHATGQIRRLLATRQPGQWVSLLVHKGSGESAVVALPLQRFPIADRWVYFYLPYLIGLVHLGAAWWVYLVRQWDRAGRLFAVAAASTGYLAAGWLDLLGPHRWVALWPLALGLAGGATAALGLYFPRQAQAAQRWPWLSPGLLTIGGLLGLGGAGAAYGWSTPWAFEGFLRAGLAYLGLGLAAFLGIQGAQYLKKGSPLAREQAGLVLLAAALSFAPPALWLLAALSGHASSPSPALLLPLTLFPLGTAYTMLRYRVLDVDALLTRGSVYLLLGVLATLSYALLVAGLSVLFSGLWCWQRPWMVGGLAFLLALVLEPARRRLQATLDRLFARRRAQYRSRLEAFSQDLIRAVNEAAIWDLLRTYIVTDLAVRPVHLFLHDAASGDYRSALDSSGEPTSDVRFRADSGFVRFLARIQRPFFLESESQLPEDLGSDASRLALLQAVLFVPLPGQQGHLVGFLALGPREQATYLAADIRYLEGLARQAALALERAQAASALARRVEQLNTLTRVAQGVNAAPFLDDLLELIAAQTRHLAPYTWLQIVLWDPQREGYYRALALLHQERLTDLEQQPLEEGVGLTWWVLREKRALRTDHYLHTCRLYGLLPEDRHLLAWMGVPLMGEEGLIGVLAVGHHHLDAHYTPEQQELLQAMADLAAGAIVKAHLLRQSEERARQLSLLNELGRLLTGTLDQEALLQHLLTGAQRLLRAQGARLWLGEPHGQGWHLAASQGRLPPAPAEGQPSAWALQAAAGQQPRCWPPSDPSSPEAPSPALPADMVAVAVPLVAQDQVIGLLEVFDQGDRSRFTPDEGQLLLALASQAAAALENARLYAQTDQALAARVEELSALELIDRELNASLDLEQAMRITLTWALRRTQSTAGLIGLVHEDHLQIVAAQGFPEQILAPYRGSGLPLTRPGLQRVLRRLSPQYLRHQAAGADFALHPEARSQALVPIPREGKAIGILLLESPHPQAFSAEEGEFLLRLVEHAAIAITNAQLYEAVQEANQAKSEFVSFVAHELKTPMTAIRGYADLLRSGVVGELNDNQRNFLDIIRTNVERMSALVSDLADISRIEAGRLRLNFQRVSVPRTVHEVVQSLGPQIQAKDQELTLEIPEDLPPVWADPMRLAQILTNLVSNAHKYTPSGGRIWVRAEVTANRWDPEGPPQVVHLQVRDTGLGIHPDEQARIFQRFFRSETDRDAREQPGTGLGLYITKSLVEMQGGKIWFESVYRQGTTFHFTVPVATAAHSAPTPGEGEGQAAPGE